MKLFALFALFLFPACAQAGDARLMFGAGYADVIDTEDAAALGRFDLTFDQNWASFIDPFVAVSGDSRGGIYAGAGISSDMDVGADWVITPSVAAGAWHAGGSVDLGGPVNFRSGLDVAYRLTHDTRLGLSFYHMSNMSLYDHNPGTEAVAVTYTITR